jgi:threonine 3-dehydrogenase
MAMSSYLSQRQKVLLLEGPEPGKIRLVERNLRPLLGNEAHVRILAAGICGTDLQILRRGRMAASYKLPVVLGHEFCGEILAVGSEVTDFRPGERVVAETHLSCGICRQCRDNRRHTCENLKVFSRLDRGGFADQAIVPAALLRHVPHHLSPSIASLSEPLGIAVRAASTHDLTDKTLMVTGCGPIGLMCIAVARRLGAKTIIATDLSSERLELAKQLGASVAINPSEQAVSAPDRRIDVAIDASGSAQAIVEALASVVTGGHLVLAGMPEAEVSLDLARHVVLREISLSGIYGRLIDETWHTVERLQTSGSFDLLPLITHEFALEDFEAAFACANSGKAGKVVFRVAE